MNSPHRLWVESGSFGICEAGGKYILWNWGNHYIQNGLGLSLITFGKFLAVFLFWGGLDGKRSNLQLIRTLFLLEYVTLSGRGQQRLPPVSLRRSQTFYSGACLTTIMFNQHDRVLMTSSQAAKMIMAVLVTVDFVCIIQGLWLERSRYGFSFVCVLFSFSVGDL